MNDTQKSFLENVVTPYFMGSIKKNIYSVIYDIDGKVFLCTEPFARMLGYNNWQEMKGKTITDFAAQMPQCDPDFYSNLEMIRQRVITERSSLEYINFGYNANGIVSHMVHHFPIFMPNGEVVASRVIANNFDIVDKGINKFMAYLKRNKAKLLDTENNTSSVRIGIALSDREYAIVFLVAAKFTLEEISIFLDISPNKVLNILEGSIRRKFGLDSFDFVSLRQFIINGNIINKLPRNFMKPRSIILHAAKHIDGEIITKS
ncbi:MAG: hypothetical protein ACK5Z5_05920 [Neisseriaceae bacterium]